MKLIGFVSVVGGLLLSAAPTHAGAASAAPRVGDVYEITRTKVSTQQANNGSSGSSRDKDMLVERVIGVREAGQDLEYNLPSNAKPEERASNWQFPARVFKPDRGRAQLLNGPELEARIDGWLKSAGWTRSICGRWVFTWNAFRIECDPQSVIKTVESFDLQSTDLRDGAAYQVADASGSGRLERKRAPRNGVAFVAEMTVNPDAIRRARAESDVVVGEIMKRPVTFETALDERIKEVISGTILVTFETDSELNVRRRTTVTKLKIKGPNDRSETETITETLERRLVSRGR